MISTKQPAKRYARDSRPKMEVPLLDLNAPQAHTTEYSLLGGGGTLNPTHPPPLPQGQGPVARANVGLVSPLIDLDAIEDDVQMVNSPRGFLQARNQNRKKNPTTVVIDEERENHAKIPENLTTAVFPYGHKKHERNLANKNQTIIDCEVYPTSKDDYIAKRKKVMTPDTEPPVPVRPKEEPTCPVCWGPFIEPCSTICGHIYCKECIILSIKKMKKCPNCRRALNAKNFHRVFLPETK